MIVCAKNAISHQSTNQTGQGVYMWFVLCSEERFVQLSHSQVQFAGHDLIYVLLEWDVASCWRPSWPWHVVTYQ